MACYQWKIQYLRGAEQRYHDMTDSLESKYMNELHRVMEDSENRGRGEQRSNANANPHLPSGKDMTARLKAKFDSLALSPEARNVLLYQVLESSQPDAQGVSTYESLLQKLEARSIIAQKLDRKKFLMYKLKLSKQQAKATNGDVQSKLEVREFMQELENLQAQLDDLYQKYEQFYGESYHDLGIVDGAA